MSKKLALQDVKNAYGAEANASSASNVDELHQEISVCSLILIIPLIIVWTHTHTHTHISLCSDPLSSPWSIF